MYILDQDHIGGTAGGPTIFARTHIHKLWTLIYFHFYIYEFYQLLLIRTIEYFSGGAQIWG